MIGARSRRILITGGNAGLGLALAKKLARHHKLLLSGRKSQVDVDGVLPRGAGYIVADQADPEMSTLTLVRGIRDFGWDSLDNAVLNAGIGVAPGEGFDSTEAIRQTLDVNLMAAILQAQALFPLLEKIPGNAHPDRLGGAFGLGDDPGLCRIQGGAARAGAVAALGVGRKGRGAGAASRAGQDRHPRQGRI